MSRTCKNSQHVRTYGQLEQEETAGGERGERESERDKPTERVLEIGYFSVGPRFRDVFVKFLQIPQASNRQNIASPKLNESADVADFT